MPGYIASALGSLKHPTYRWEDVYSKEVTENLFLFFSIELIVTCREFILKDGGFLKWWLILRHLQTLDLLGTRAPSALVCAEGDVTTELEELEASQAHCVTYSGPCAAREGFFASSFQ